MTTVINNPEWVESKLSPEQARWFIEQLQQALSQSQQENEMLRNQIDRLKEVKR